ncbi:MAG: ABC transporter ATP-binding protein [Pseudomonadota bacterium]
MSKSYRRPGGTTVVAQDISLVIPTGRSVALLGRNGAGKSTLLRVIAGVSRPDAGEVRCAGRVSWPVGFAGGFHPDLTGAENVRFAARAYGADASALLDFVARFANIGPHFHRPVKTYSSGMRARVAFGLSMGMPFDIYLVDEITAVGDLAFREASDALLAARLADAGAVVVSHSIHQLSRLCTSGMVLEGGRLTWHDDVAHAIEHHRALMACAA